MIKIALVALALAGATGAAAETPLVAFGFGADVVEAFSGDIAGVEQSHDSHGRPAVSIRLAPRFDTIISEVTARNVKKRGFLKICGEVVIEPVLLEPLISAEFQITGIDMTEANRLALLIGSASCGVLPSS